MSEKIEITKEEQEILDKKKLKNPYKNNKYFDEEIIYKEIEDAPKLEDIEVDLDGESIDHIKNSKLKRKNAKIGYTEDHIKEIIKCKNDINYFANNYFYIRSLDHGMIKMKLRPYQKQLVKNLVSERFNIVNASRQSGKCCYNCKITIKDEVKNEVYDIKIDDFYRKLKGQNKLQSFIFDLKYSFLCTLNKFLKKIC